MKKKITLCLLSLLFISCSNDDDCAKKKSEISSFYDRQIELCYSNPSIDGVDYRKIQLLRQEKEIKLANACN